MVVAVARGIIPRRVRRRVLHAQGFLEAGLRGG